MIIHLRFMTLLLAIEALFIHHSCIYTASMVYSFRIAQVTKQFQLDKEYDEQENKQGNKQEEEQEKKDAPETSTTLIGLLFGQVRKRPENVYRNYLGALGSFIYRYERFYSRVDSAFAHLTETQNHVTTFEDTQTDDILVSLGYNFFRTDYDLVNLTGLAGFPTHRIVRLQHPDFGYGQFSAGCQLDGSHAFSLDYKTIFMYGLRYINFMPRSALDTENKKYEFTMGNFFDIFLANKHHIKSHTLEYGYTTRFRFGPFIAPPLDDVVERNKLIRNTFYFLYKYDFAVCDVNNSFLVNLSYGFDSKPKFGNKYLITLWASLNTTF